MQPLPRPDHQHAGTCGFRSPRSRADIAPLLVISTASLEALGESAQRAIPMETWPTALVAVLSTLVRAP